MWKMICWSVLRFSPEGEISVAPFLNVPFKQQMVPVGILEQLAAEIEMIFQICCFYQREIDYQVANYFYQIKKRLARWYDKLAPPPYACSIIHNPSRFLHFLLFA